MRNNALSHYLVLYLELGLGLGSVDFVVRCGFYSYCEVEGVDNVSGRGTVVFRASVQVDLRQVEQPFPTGGLQRPTDLQL